MEIRQLQSFREVVREGSFTGAAKTLRMTQPGVSLHVKSLEQEVGARLMERDARGVRLTTAGKVLLEAADVILGAMEDATRRIRELEAPERGSVILACGDTVALYLLPPVLSAFRALRPLAELSIRNHASRRVLDLVMRREADIGIVTRPPWLDPLLWGRTILVERFWLALPPGHALENRPEIVLSDLHGQSAVLLARPAETRALLERTLRDAGVRLNVVMDSGNLEVVKAYVAGGMGLTILPDMVVTESDRERMVIRPLPGGFPQRRLAVVRRKDRHPSLLATDLLRLLAERFRRAAVEETD